MLREVEIGPKNIANIFGIDDILIAAAISAAGSYAANKSAQGKAEKAANADREQQGALSARQQDLAELMNKQGLATQVDAEGNITYYDQGTNTWRTILAPQQRQIQDASNLEQLRSLSYEAPAARGEALRNSQRRVLDSGTADTLRTQMNDKIAGTGAASGSRIADSLRGARQLAVSQGFDDVQAGLTSQAIRSGASGVGQIGGQLAKARSQAIAQTMGNPDIEGRQLASDINATETGNAINNYSAMASRASAIDGAAYTPSNIAPNLSAALSAARTAAMSGTANAANATANAARTLQGMPQVPIQNNAATFASLGSLYKAFADTGFGLPKKRTPSSVNREGGSADELIYS